MSLTHHAHAEGGRFHFQAIFGLLWLPAWQFNFVCASVYTSTYWLACMSSLRKWTQASLSAFYGRESDLKSAHQCSVALRSTYQGGLGLLADDIIPTKISGLVSASKHPPCPPGINTATRHSCSHAGLLTEQHLHAQSSHVSIRPCPNFAGN